MAQTPEQRMRNARFTKAQDASRGKPEAQRVINKKKDKELKSPVSMGVLLLLAFVVFGGIIFEVLYKFFG